MTGLTDRMTKPTWCLWMATEFGSKHSATGWFASGYVLPHEASELFKVECSVPVHAVVLYREYVAIDRPVGLYMQDIVDRTPLAERARIVRHYIGDDLYQSSKGAEHSILDQIDSILLRGEMGRADRAGATHERGSTVRAMLQIAGDVLDGKCPDTDNLAAFFIDGECESTLRALPRAMPAYNPVSRPKENARDILEVPGSESEACLAVLEYGVSGFINGDLNAALEEERRRRQHARYFHPDLGRVAQPRPFGGPDEAMTNYVMARRLDEANQGENRILQRKRRGR